MIFKLLHRVMGLSHLISSVKNLSESRQELREQVAYLQKRINNHEELTRQVLGCMISSDLKSGIRGVNDQSSPEIVISLTSYPKRIHNAEYSIYTLLNQTYKPNAVVLWLAKSQFPDKESSLPKTLLDLKTMGLTIKWCDDVKSYKKIIPAIKEYPECLIATADDDIFYRSNWLESLVTAYKKDTRTVFAHRCHRILFNTEGELMPYHSWAQKNSNTLAPSVLNFPTSGAGVLYYPGCFYQDISNKELFERLAPYCDDTWLWVMLALKGTPVRRVDNSHQEIIVMGTSLAERDESLTKVNKKTTGGCLQKDHQILQVLGHYPGLKKIIKQAQ